MTREDEKRFWGNVRLKKPIAPGMLTLCWQYGEGSRYGMVTVNGEQVYAHVYAWQLKHGNVPQGFTLHHLCSNKRCVNTDHIVLATSSGHKRQLHSVKLIAHFSACGCPFDDNNDLINAAGYRLCRKHQPIPALCATPEQEECLAKVAKLANVYGVGTLGRRGPFPISSVGLWLTSRQPIPINYFPKIDELHAELD
jgi:hypothetical protein